MDVYQGAHAAIFLCSLAEADTLEYVRRQLPAVPAHVPTVVLANFRDAPQSDHEFGPEELEALQRGEGVKGGMGGLPRRVVCFEASLANCFGLDVLHSYLSVPFLELKRATVAQQLALLEDELTAADDAVRNAVNKMAYARHAAKLKGGAQKITPRLKKSPLMMLVSQVAKSATGNTEAP